jgi:hypothetical protein
MAKESINLVPDSVIQKQAIRYQIESGQMTNAIYETLPPDQQQLVREVLFEMYQNPIPDPVALSGLEFTVFGLAKLFFAMFPPSATPQYPPEVQAFYEALKSYVDQHEITLDPNDWYIPYALQQMLKVKENRAEYKAKKIEIVGEF